MMNFVVFNIAVIWLATLSKASDTDVYGYSCLLASASYDFGCPMEGDPYDMVPCICEKPAFLQTAVGCIVTYATPEYIDYAFNYINYVCPPDGFDYDGIVMNVTTELYNYSIPQLIANVPYLPTNLTQAQLNSTHSEAFIVPYDAVKDKFASEVRENKEDRKPGMYA